MLYVQQVWALLYEVIAPYTPQHNGLAEKKQDALGHNQVYDQGEEATSLSMREAVLAAAFFLNKSPTKALPDCNPKEARLGNKLDMRHLRIFGLVCYKHVLDERRKKLYDRSETLILVGYHPIGAYKLYDLEKKQVVINRDVLVDEAVTFDWVKVEAGYAVVSSWLEEKKSDDVERVLVDVEANNIRSQRACFPSTRLAGHEVFTDNDIADSGDLVHFAFLADVETLSWEQAINIKDWKEAMLEDLKAIEKNRTWEMVELPQHKQAIEVKWVFKTKYKPDGSIAKLKARLVAKGFL